MKLFSKLYTVLIFSMMVNISQAQTIEHLSISPTPTTVDDSIKVVSRLFYQNTFFIDSVYADVIGNDIKVLAYCYLDSQNMAMTVYDTASIGKLNAGNYRVYYYTIDVKSRDTNDVDTLNFTVTGSIGFSINPIETLNIKVYPNPAKEYIYIDVPEEVYFSKVRMRSINGALMYEHNFFEKEIDISDLKVGTYILELEQKSKVIYKSFIISP